VWLDGADLAVTATATSAFAVEAVTVAFGGRVVGAGDGRLQVVAPGSSSSDVARLANIATVTKLLPG